jgi:glyoxylase-like metal-dependent hydrolase (beta-lactamase superfamily II)
VLVIDTRTTPGHAAELKADIRRITPLPVTAVVNTHGHSDHVFGNHSFRPARIWGHVRCAEMVVQTGELQRAALRDAIPPIAADLDEVVLDPPDVTFDERAVLAFEGREIELRYLGRGHTDNDIVVLIPDAGVCFAGDLLENGAPPFFGDGYPIDWPATVARLIAVAPALIVPGHGDIADRAFAGAELEELRAVAELARAVHEGAFGLDEAVRRGPFGPEASREPIERGLAQLLGELD